MKPIESDVNGAHRRALIERLPGYRWFVDSGQFKCPCCDHSGLIQFDHAARTEVLECMDGCAEAKILAWAERQPSRGAHAGQQKADWQLSDRERVQARRPQRERGTSWPSPEYELARLEARAEAEALFDASRAGADNEPILSSLADAEPVPEPSILRLPNGTYLLRRGWVHLFHGKPFCGKTPLCYIAVVEVVQAGEFVLLVDYEMGAAGAKALLIELGLSESQIRDQVLYAYNPHKWTASQRDQLAAEVEARAPDLVVIDSLSRSMATAGLNQNDATETDAWFHSLPTWAVDQFGSAVMLIDHTTRTDGPHPSGSIQKTAAPQFHVWVQNVKPFSRDHEDGCSLLMVQKDRSGQRTLGRPVAELRTVLGGSFVLREVDQSTSVTSGDEVEVDLGALPYSQQVRLEVHDALRQAGAEGVTKTKVTDPSPGGDGGGANAKVRREQLDWLEKHGHAVWRREPGTSRGQRWWAVEFFPGDPDE